ncbi:O-methyltransferase-domain-containing protein [Desarmillaria tabescens]|uniref:O-methyltransferase-domain-containing protein n=1 Tax=Armillaria tabescens TaxID=1929756 RepID=A0AA39N687_ARMTA|nr:O-methyltransferase-domain-containing protein [Desarmillaria tabescens]KAK0458974.1 O-methyltransferase-domain-containing protein [Desarmillaria tabescens]
MTSPLRALLNILQESIERIEKECQGSGVEFPVLDEPYTPDSEAVRLTPAVQEASILITAAAYQLIATVQQPQMHVFNAGCSYYLSASLRAAIETNVVEILREAGPEGLHITDIATQNNVDHMKLSRIMRFLATHHIFKEISPDVYANNRLSSICDTGKPLAKLLDSPLEKHDGTNGIAALIGHCADEDYKGAGYITEHLTNPETAQEDSAEHSPMMQAFGCDLGVWNWLEQPSNQLRLRRFGVAMDGVNRMQPPDSILKGFSWGNLPDNSIVVDVGGGIGVSSITLVKAHPHIRCIIQDRPPVIAQGKKHCEQVLPHALASGRIQYIGNPLIEMLEHDFFDVQCQLDASVFLLKQITHDWSDQYVARILRHLRHASTATTKLVLVDCIIPHTCRAPQVTIPGADFPTPPAPLLANMGAANASPYFTDLSMYVHFNGQDRTLAHIVELLNRAGWAVERMYPGDSIGNYLPQIIATPV